MYNMCIFPCILFLLVPSPCSSVPSLAFRCITFLLVGEISMYLGMALRGSQPFKMLWPFSWSLVVVYGTSAMHNLWRTTRSAAIYATGITKGELLYVLQRDLEVS